MVSKSLAETGPAAFDPTSMAVRRESVETLEHAFRDFAPVVHAISFMVGPDRVSGISTTGNADEPLTAMSFVLHTAHSILSGATSLLVGNNSYASAALIRQLVEVEYLAWACAEDPNEARQWLTSTPSDRRKRWQPRLLRERSGGRFSAEDYASHCESGGHPTPKGVRSFITGSDAGLTVELNYWEAAHHGFGIWGYATKTAPNLWSEARKGAVRYQEQEWKQHDLLGRIDFRD